MIGIECVLPCEHHLGEGPIWDLESGFAKEMKPQFLAGSLFRVTGLGIRGVPEPRFAG